VRPRYEAQRPFRWYRLTANVPLHCVCSLYKSEYFMAVSILFVNKFSGIQRCVCV
jgi:hypothetical protein